MQVRAHSRRRSPIISSFSVFYFSKGKPKYEGGGLRSSHNQVGVALLHLHQVTVRVVGFSAVGIPLLALL